MKKFFALAIAAIAFVSCSSESTEELANLPVDTTTRAKIQQDNNGEWVCTLRGDQCLWAGERPQGNENGDHSHCEKESCRYYFEPLSAKGQMDAHAQANNLGFEGDHEGGHGTVR